ncbi:MAG: ribose-5-phosphate isomerase [Myxococcales bacterium]|nr:MAG: ribose-5-phosphate isomerase [Myxococcales bacterium]
MRVHIGSDHAGLEIKAQLISWLEEQGHEPVDHGPFQYDALDDYPVFCLRAAQGVVDDAGSMGIVFGGSGNGEQMAANKVAGIRAALVWSEATAVLAREHNDANVISLGARQHTHEEMLHFIDTFLNTPFTGDERHVRRIGQMASYETTKEFPPLPESAVGLGPDA